MSRHQIIYQSGEMAWLNCAPSVREAVNECLRSEGEAPMTTTEECDLIEWLARRPK